MPRKRIKMYIMCVYIYTICSCIDTYSNPEVWKFTSKSQSSSGSLCIQSGSHLTCWNITILCCWYIHIISKFFQRNNHNLSCSLRHYSCGFSMVLPNTIDCCSYNLLYPLISPLNPINIPLNPINIPLLSHHIPLISYHIPLISN